MRRVSLRDHHASEDRTMNKNASYVRTGRRSAFAVLSALGVLGLLSASALRAPDYEKPNGAANRYIGSAKCKNCHQADANGNQYGAWSDAKHSHAYEVLETDEAKQVGAARGIANPVEAGECLKCHTTAYGEDKKLIKRGFKIEAGVQCETCHGPGEQHMKARFAAAADAGDDEGFGDEEPGWVGLPEGEIITVPPAETCAKCHNNDAPNFKGFCYYQFVQKISHLDPRKDRPAAKEIVCGCGHPEGHICSDACVTKGG
jgi:predicted CXXCH cytochrome family protein